MAAEVGKVMLRLILPIDNNVNDITDIPGWRVRVGGVRKIMMTRMTTLGQEEIKTQKNARGRGRH